MPLSSSSIVLPCQFSKARYGEMKARDLSKLFIFLAGVVAPFLLYLQQGALLDGASSPEHDPSPTLLSSPSEYFVPDDDWPMHNIDTNNTVAYAISITGCGNTDRAAEQLLQGAAVLGHSIKLNSASTPESGSRYEHKLIAFVHPDALACSERFAALGYEIQIRPVPVNVSEIRGEFLRTHVHKIGCCGAKEYLKLYSYQLTAYNAVVHLDVDCIILKPLDDLFDVMTEGPLSPAASKIPVMHGRALPGRVDAFFSRDYNMVHVGKKYPGFQGGFLVFRPSMEAYQEYVDIILEGNFVAGQGWNGTFGGYWGAQQIQGICSYFYDGLHPDTAVELNRCIYNQMVDAPSRDVNGEEKCIDGMEECEDCRRTDISEILSAHFTQECGKPWDCSIPDESKSKFRLCRELKRQWHLTRKKLVDSRSSSGAWPFQEYDGKHEPDVFQGHCKQVGAHGYLPFQI
jgi:hypothetical protein